MTLADELTGRFRNSDEGLWADLRHAVTRLGYPPIDVAIGGVFDDEDRTAFVVLMTRQGGPYRFDLHTIRDGASTAGLAQLDARERRIHADAVTAAARVLMQEGDERDRYWRSAPVLDPIAAALAAFGKQVKAEIPDLAAAVWRHGHHRFPRIHAAFTSLPRSTDALDREVGLIDVRVARTTTFEHLGLHPIPETEIAACVWFEDATNDILVWTGPKAIIARTDELPDEAFRELAADVTRFLEQHHDFIVRTIRRDWAAAQGG